VFPSLPPVRTGAGFSTPGRHSVRSEIFAATHHTEFHGAVEALFVDIGDIDDSHLQRYAKQGEKTDA
jgi:hypothetical protein